MISTDPMFWKAAGADYRTKNGAHLPEVCILLEDGSRVVGEAQSLVEAEAIAEAHNRVVRALLTS